MRGRFLFIVAASLILMACSSTEKTVATKPDVPVETITPSPDPTPPAPPAPNPAPTPDLGPSLEELVKVYGEPVNLRSHGSGKYALVNVIYDSNGNLNADPDEPVLRNWGVAPTHFDTYNTRVPITTGQLGGVLLELPQTLDAHGFSPIAPRASDMHSVWHGQMRVLEQSLQIDSQTIPTISLVAACRIAETSNVEPLPNSQEMRGWRCEPTKQMPNTVPATWQQIGDGVQASGGNSIGWLSAFSVSTSPQYTMSLAIENPFFDVHYSFTGFSSWNGDKWVNSATQVSGWYNDLDRKVLIDSDGRFLVTKYTGNMSTNQSFGILRWEGNQWSDPIPLSDSFLNRTFFLDSNNRIHRLRHQSKGDLSIAERWDGSKWIQIGEAFGYLRDVGRSLHFARDNEVFAISGGGYGPSYWTNIRRLKGNTWDQSLETPDFPRRMSRYCSDLQISQSKKLLFNCRVDLQSNAEYTPNNTLLVTTLSLFEDDHWSTLSFGPNFDATAFDSSERPIVTDIEDGSLYVRRWNGERWETLGDALNAASRTVATGKTIIATADNCSVYVAWMGDKDGSRRVFVSKLQE